MTRAPSLTNRSRARKVAAAVARHGWYLNAYGYLHTKLWRAGKPRTVMQHRFIWEKYYGVRLRRDQVVHHKNEVKTDNRIRNLQVMTKSEHARLHDPVAKFAPHVSRNGRLYGSVNLLNGGSAFGEKSCHAKLTDAQVRKIWNDRRPVAVIMEEYGVSHTTVYCIRRGERRSEAIHGYSARQPVRTEPVKP